MLKEKVMRSGDFLKEYDLEQARKWKSLPNNKKQIWIEYVILLNKNDDKKTMEFFEKNFLEVCEVDIPIIPDYLIKAIDKGLQIDYALL